MPGEENVLNDAVVNGIGIGGRHGRNFWRVQGLGPPDDGSAEVATAVELLAQPLDTNSYLPRSQVVPLYLTASQRKEKQIH